MRGYSNNISKTQAAELSAKRVSNEPDDTLLLKEATSKTPKQRTQPWVLVQNGKTDKKHKNLLSKDGRRCR